MKQLLLTTIAAVVLVGCGGSIHQAAYDGNIEAVKQNLAAGTNVNAKDDGGMFASVRVEPFAFKAVLWIGGFILMSTIHMLCAPLEPR